MLDYSRFKKIAFSFDPELMHDFTFQFFHYLPGVMKTLFPGANFENKKECYRIKGAHLDWQFPVGAAAGLDKNGLALKYLSLLGFGAVEVGTVTPIRQKGNSKPRVFRYPLEEALRNSMGFPNKGQEKILQSLENFSHDKLLSKANIGINIGANKDNVGGTLFFEDIINLYKTFAELGEYLVINISSPNTQGLRNWQKGGELKDLLDSLSQIRKEKNGPLFLKIAPDLSMEEVRTIVDISKEFSLSGLIATNTTIDPNRGKGGVSGRPLYQKSKAIRKLILELFQETPNMDLIGVGGFFDLNEIVDYWASGGRFLQIYTSFIYKGPDVLKEIQTGIDQLLLKSQASTLQELLSQPKDLNSVYSSIQKK